MGSTLTALLCRAVADATALPQALIECALDPATPGGADIAGAMARRPDMSVELRGKLTLRAASDGSVNYVTDLLSAYVCDQIAAGVPLLTAVRAAWETPAGRALPAEVLGGACDRDNSDALVNAVLQTSDVDVLQHACAASVRPLELAHHLDDLWGQTDDVALRKTIRSGGAVLLRGMDRARRKTPQRDTWWDNIVHDELVLHWAARSGRLNGSDGLRVLAAERVLPTWIAGSIPGQGALADVFKLVQETAASWPPELLDLVAGQQETILAAGGTTRASIVTVVTKETTAREARSYEKRLLRAKSDPLRSLHDWGIAAAWLLENTPNDTAAWSTMLAVADNDRSDNMSAEDLLTVAAGVTA